MYFWTDLNGILNWLELLLQQFLKYFKFRLKYIENSRAALKTRNKAGCKLTAF